ncbi:indoleamine 2,3-dioxygenase 2-like [Liolophura sinensis]|uniref:indoleamine 2,3-dioxygenase 2-like n=1 Tax=Liolophura sinensis TaxID=3198878 RepID=UPI003157F7DE
MSTVVPLKLSEFNISDCTGFLIEDPLERLPEPFEVWHKLAKSLPELVKKGVFRDAVDELPILDSSVLKDERQQRLAHLQLSVIASGYVWQDENVPKKLPVCVAIPLWNVSETLGVKPVVSHPGLFLANWQRKDTSELPSLSNMRCLYSLPGGEDADWFLIITNAVELEFAPALKCIVNGAYSMDIGDMDGLASELIGIRDALVNMKETFTNIHDKVSPAAFYNDLRPFLGGWGKEGSALPDGLLFEGVSDVPVKCIGDTGAQTSIFACLDAFLGIQHSQPESKTFLLLMKDYMVREHRMFVEALEKRPSTREFVVSSCDEKLKGAYNDCLTAAADFRSFHIQVVAKYIVSMANKDQQDSKEKSEDKGTGGTNVMPFLKGLRTETKDSVITK